MPRLNGTGPEGEGPLTGRGFGDCEGTRANNSNCWGMGRGGRRCRRVGTVSNQGSGRGIWRVGSPNDEVQELKQRISELESKLQQK